MIVCYLDNTATLHFLFQLLEVAPGGWSTENKFFKEGGSKWEDEMHVRYSEIIF